jgi:hypothetical protein
MMFPTKVVQKINGAVLEMWNNTVQSDVKDYNTAHALCMLDNWGYTKNM